MTRNPSCCIERCMSNNHPPQNLCSASATDLRRPGIQVARSPHVLITSLVQKTETKTVTIQRSLPIRDLFYLITNSLVSANRPFGPARSYPYDVKRRTVGGSGPSTEWSARGSGATFLRYPLTRGYLAGQRCHYPWKSDTVVFHDPHCQVHCIAHLGTPDLG